MERPANELELIPDTLRVSVDDVAAARAFYQDVLRLPLRADTPEYLVFGLGSLQLVVELADANETEDGERVGRFVGFSLRVRDIQQAHRELETRGVSFVGAPQRQPWGGTLAHFRDPAGNVFTLVEHPRAEAR